MNILAFAASNSRTSINKQLIAYAASRLSQHQVDIIDINDFEMPIYSVDLEEAHGIPAAAEHFFERIGQADALLIAYAEHNGNYTVAYKNLFDWTSRVNQHVYQGKPIIMLSTSPGPGGAQSVLALASESAHYFNGEVRGALSIPSFYDNFDQQTCAFSNPDLIAQLEAVLAKFESH